MKDVIEQLGWLPDYKKRGQKSFWFCKEYYEIYKWLSDINKVQSIEFLNALISRWLHKEYVIKDKTVQLLIQSCENIMIKCEELSKKLSMAWKRSHSNQYNKQDSKRKWYDK